MRRNNRPSVLLLGAVVLVLGAAYGCGAPPADSEGTSSEMVMPAYADTIQLRTYADTLAMQVYEAFGGPAVWTTTPYVQFNFAIVRGVERRTVYRHAWNRMTGDYRVEMPGPANEPYVVLMNVNTSQGAAYYDGFPLDSAATVPQLETAYRRFINDTSWLLAPFDLFDPGVQRTYVADSSDAETDVLHVALQDVDMTPFDRYWLYVDKETGLIRRWAYILKESPTGPPRFFAWEDYELLEGPAGPLQFATRKRSDGAPYAVHTESIRVPAEVPDGLFTDPRPQLTPVGGS